MGGGWSLCFGLGSFWMVSKDTKQARKAAARTILVFEVDVRSVD